MIGVGGPLANMFAYCFNDFTDAFHGLNVDWLGEVFTNYAPWRGALIALTCWNGTRKGHKSDADTGYATISTFMDINGTVCLLIWDLDQETSTTRPSSSTKKSSKSCSEGAPSNA